MERYDYYEAVKADVCDYINEEIDVKDYSDREELETFLNDDLWTNDNVTGNGSGSYTYDAWKAEECLAHNWELLAKVLNEFVYPGNSVINRGAEWADVMIRCYILGQAIAAVLDEMEAAGELEFKDDEEDAE